LRSTKIFSLLQPPPETVANFDELILLGEGKIIYSGPVNEVIDYFDYLGYEIPERMDVADWLQVSNEMTDAFSFMLWI
jgi:ABC-type multidrug transport system ATPase subunit